MDMKRVIKYFVLLPFISACMQEPVTNPAPDVTESSSVCFEAQIASPEDQPESKTALGEKYEEKYYPNYWSSGDAISVNGVESKALASDSEFVGTSKATFEMKAQVSAPYCFVYPASAVSDYNNGSATVNLPQKQEWISTTYDPAAFLMMGTADIDMLKFNPMMSAIRLNVTSNHGSKLRSVTFMTLGDEKVSGEFTTDFAGLTPTADSYPYVHLIAPNKGVAFGCEVYLLIPSQTYASGMAFAFRAVDGTQMTYSTKSSFTAEAGKIYPLNVTYVPKSSSMMLMSSNVRFISSDDTGDRAWENRRSAYYKMLNTMSPDIVGLQEAEQQHVKDILENCADYSYVGYGRKSGKDILYQFSTMEQLFGNKHSESTTILYKTDKFTRHSDGWFCHSDNPNKAGSYFAGTEDEQPRISTWAIFTHKDTGKKFFYLNSHTCLYDEPMQKEIKLIRDKVKELNTENLPVVLSADWNLEEDDSWMTPITSVYQSARKTAPVSDNSCTFHWWGTQERQIDHIFYSGLECFEFHTVDRKWNDLYISDHYPIYAKFHLAEFTVPVYTETVEGNAGHENYDSESLF